MKNQRIGVMFVCLGNICRSPLAEAIFKQKLADRGLADRFFVESSGTANYHVGEEPDPRTVAVAQRRNVPMEHLAQQLKEEHFHLFDYVVAMDRNNRANALKISPSNTVFEIPLMRDFDELAVGADVVDPWYGNEEGFDACFDVLDRSCE